MSIRGKGAPPKNPIKEFIDNAYKHGVRIAALLKEAGVVNALAYEAALDQQRHRQFDAALAQAYNTAYSRAQQDALQEAQQRKQK